LNRVQSGPFFDLIANDPEGKGIWQDLILPDSPNFAVVITRCPKWDGVDGLLRVVY
jgi:hypothetical protein